MRDMGKDDRRKIEIPPGTKYGKCKGRTCGVKILFVPNPRDPSKKIPVDFDGTPHWATCKEADRFRKPQFKTQPKPLEGRR